MHYILVDQSLVDRKNVAQIETFGFLLHHLFALKSIPN